MRRFAIVGSGPAGCYLAQQLLRGAADVSVDVIERLPTPFGLIRYGVAPDHQGAKAIQRILGTVLGDGRVRFLGHVEVGRDVALSELRQIYDGVVLATGAPAPRRLGVPGEALGGVVTSADFVGWYNAAPGCVAPRAAPMRSAVVIGNGNVALDVTRVLARGADDFANSDLGMRVAGWLDAQPLRCIHVIGRGDPTHVRFGLAELRELGRLARVRVMARDRESLEQASATHAVAAELLRFDASPSPSAQTEVRFHFETQVVEFLRDQRLRAVHLERIGGVHTECTAELAVSCIGYRAVGCDGLKLEGGHFANDGGRIHQGLYVAGWAAHGAHGTIADNRGAARVLATRILQEVQDGVAAPPQAIIWLLAERDVSVVDWAGWQKIDRAEVARAAPGRRRWKFESVAEMLAIAADHSA